MSDPSLLSHVDARKNRTRPSLVYGCLFNSGGGALHGHPFTIDAFVVLPDDMPAAPWEMAG
jgi:hypothetical protein